MKSNKLKAKIMEKGKNYDDCAKYIGVNPSTFCQKVNLLRDFKLQEVNKLCDFLELNESEKIDIFLS